MGNKFPITPHLYWAVAKFKSVYYEEIASDANNPFDFINELIVSGDSSNIIIAEEIFNNYKKKLNENSD